MPTPCGREPPRRCWATPCWRPSTLGTFLRSFTWSHARQLDKVSTQLLARAFAAGSGPGAAPVTIDVDSSICETYGLAKQGGSKFTYCDDVPVVVAAGV